MICGCLNCNLPIRVWWHTLELWLFWSQTGHWHDRIPTQRTFFPPFPARWKINHYENHRRSNVGRLLPRGYYSDMRQLWRLVRSQPKKYTELFKIYGARNVYLKKKKDCETALRGVHLYLMSDSVVSSRAPTFQGRQDISSSSPATSAPPPRRKPHLPPPPPPQS